MYSGMMKGLMNHRMFGESAAAVVGPKLDRRRRWLVLGKREEAQRYQRNIPLIDKFFIMFSGKKKEEEMAYPKKIFLIPKFFIMFFGKKKEEEMAYPKKIFLIDKFSLMFFGKKKEALLSPKIILPIQGKISTKIGCEFMLFLRPGRLPENLFTRNYFPSKKFLSKPLYLLADLFKNRASSKYHLRSSMVSIFVHNIA